MNAKPQIKTASTVWDSVLRMLVNFQDILQALSEIDPDNETRRSAYKLQQHTLFSILSPRPASLLLNPQEHCSRDICIAAFISSNIAVS